MKMNFDYFQIQKQILQIIKVEKVDEKNGVICQVSMFPYWVTALELIAKVHFFQLCAELSKKLKSVKAIYIYAFESSHYTLSEYDIVYRGLSNRSWDISH